MAVSLLMTAPVVLARAAPDNVDSGANYSVFLQAIAGDGIVMDNHQAIREAYALCKLMQPPNGASLWDAAQHVQSTHPDWGIESALHFADRSVQDVCPNRGTF